MFYELLKELRQKKGVTGETVANAVGLSESAYRNYERGVREPNFETLCKLADYYGVTTDYLLGREPLPNPFADLGLSAEDEKDVLAKYMSLPPTMRACLLECLRQLGGAVKTIDDNSGGK